MREGDGIPSAARGSCFCCTPSTLSPELPTSWALPSPLPLIPVSPGGLWNRAEAKNTSSLSDFIFRPSPEGAVSELLLFA